MNKIIVIGDAMLDRYHFGSITRMSPEAPVPIVKVDYTEDRLGGAANVANNLKGLGADVLLCSAVGIDDAGESLERLLHRNQINHELQKERGGTTTLKVRTIVRNQQVSRMDFEKRMNTTTWLGLWHHYSQNVDAYDVVVFSDYDKGSLHAVNRLMKEAKIKIVDPKGTNWEKYRGATIITPNTQELKAIVGEWKDEDELHKMTKSLMRRLDIGCLLLTRSEKGMTLFRDDERIHYPAIQQQVCDVTGAGDTVVATLAWALANNKDLEEAVQLSLKAASKVITQIGTTRITKEDLA